MKSKNIFIVFIILAGSIGIFACKEKKSEIQIKPYTVQVIIALPEQKKTFALQFQKPNSVLDIMKMLQKQHKIHFTVTGKGDMIFLTEIDQIQNEGSGKDKKNWIYAVNGKLADRGIAVFIVDQDSRIQWCYVSWKDRQKCTDY